MEDYNFNALAVLFKTIFGEYHIETKEIKKQVKSGVIYVPQKFIGKKLLAPLISLGKMGIIGYSLT